MPDQFPLVFSTLGCPDWSLERAAEQAVQDGYVGLEVRILNGEVIPADLDQEQQSEIRQIRDRHNLEIVAIGASTRFSSPDREVRLANQEELRRYLRLANALNVPMIRTFGGDVHKGHTLEETVDWVADGVAGVLPEAETQGVTVILETHDAFCKGADVAKVLDQIDHSHLKAVWDVHHPYRKGESIEETWRYIGDRVAHVHIKDARRLPDGSSELVLLDEGEVPCKEVVKLLQREGYSGYLCAEWEKKWHPEIEEPEVALPQHARALRDWMGGSS